MKVYILLSSLLLSLFNSVGDAFAAPRRATTKTADLGIEYLMKPLLLLEASLADDDSNNDGMLDELDQEWLNFQEQQQQSKKEQQLLLSDFATAQSSVGISAADDDASSLNQVAAAGFCCFLAIGCLVAVYYSGEAPVLVIDA